MKSPCCLFLYVPTFLIFKRLMRSLSCLCLRLPLNFEADEAYKIALLSVCLSPLSMPVNGPSVYLCVPPKCFVFYAVRAVSNKVGDQFFPEKSV
jgi:hypothetical protein